VNQTWITDVLSDLKLFAAENNMPELEAALEAPLRITYASAKKSESTAIEINPEYFARFNSKRQ
jgi:hypothetical protein